MAYHDDDDDNDEDDWDDDDDDDDGGAVWCTSPQWWPRWQKAATETQVLSLSPHQHHEDDEDGDEGQDELTNTILNLPKLQVGSCPGQTCQNSQPVAGSNLSTTYGCLFSSKSATDRQIGPENQQPTVNTQHLSWQNRRPPRSPHNITELQRVIININFHPPFQLHQLAVLDMLFQPVLEIHKHFSAASTKKAPIVPMLGSLALVSRFSNVS